jgi:hypothetical protein
VANSLSSTASENIMRLQPGSQEKKILSRTQSHKGIVASENLVKFVLRTNFVFVCGLGLSSPYTGTMVKMSLGTGTEASAQYQHFVAILVIRTLSGWYDLNKIPSIV